MPELGSRRAAGQTARYSQRAHAGEKYQQENTGIVTRLFLMVKADTAAMLARRSSCPGALE
jgi:hypothetical protein